MKMKLTKKEIIDLAVHIDRVNGHRGAKFNYALCVNQEEAAKVKRAVEKINKPDDGYMEYEKDRLALCDELADKDEAGRPKQRAVMLPDGTRRSEYVGVDTNPDFKVRMDAMQEKYADAIKARREQEAEVEELLQEEAEIDLHMVRFSDVPETITGAEMKLIVKMILPPEDDVTPTPLRDVSKGKK